MSNIKFLREKAQLSKTQLAKFVGVTPPMVSIWENTDAQPSIDAQKKLAKALNCQVDDLGIIYRNKLEEMRKKSGLKQTELARACGVCATTISNLETGVSELPEYATLEKIANVYGCKPSDLGSFCNDLKDQVFGDLLVLECLGLREGPALMWKCKCLLCDESVVKSSTYLKGTPHGMCEKCFQNSRANNFTRGDVYGKLTVLEKTDNRYTSINKTTGEEVSGLVMWRCQCECEEITEVSSYALTHAVEPACEKCIRAKRVEQTSAMRVKSHICGTSPGKLTNTDKLNIRNTSGKHGVHWNKKLGNWGSSITLMRRRYSLGVYDDYDRAVAIREKAEKLLFKGFLDWLSVQPDSANANKTDFYSSQQYSGFFEWRKTIIHIKKP